MSKPIILTGLRANGEFHIGNYMGAILPIVEMQQKHANDYQINMFVPDLHSFITPIDHSQLQKNIQQNLKTFVAAGLDITHEDTYIYRQSYISAHSELTWILDCFSGFGELSRMTQFKDKSDGQKEDHINVGIFNYPVLMAADIILYGAEWVPVGEDQRQHLELTRDLAIRMNNKFERELFVVPHEWDKQLAFSGRDSGVRIRSLRNPEKKMSKSIEDPAGTIMMSDSPEEAAKKIMGATTDSYGEIKFDMKERPGVSNLVQIVALLTHQAVQDVAKAWEGKTSYGDLKKAAATEVERFMKDFQAKLAAVDEQAIQDKLEYSEVAMREVANKTLHKVQRAVGLRPREEPKAHQLASQHAKAKEVAFSDFSKLDVKIGKVINAEVVPDAEKLIKLTVDTGDRQRTILTSMREKYRPEYFMHKLLPILCNLKPQQFKGQVSEGMLLAIDSSEGPVLLHPETSVTPGTPMA